ALLEEALLPGGIGHHAAEDGRHAGHGDGQLIGRSTGGEQGNRESARHSRILRYRCSSNSARLASSMRMFQTCSRSWAKRGDARVARVRGRGKSTSTISATPLGRPLSTITRSPIRTASSMEWVTKIIEVGRIRQM